MKMSTPDFAKPWFIKNGGTLPIAIIYLILFYGILPKKKQAAVWAVWG